MCGDCPSARRCSRFPRKTSLRLVHCASRRFALLETNTRRQRLSYGGMIITSALLPAHLNPDLSPARPGAPVLFLPLSGRAVFSQSDSAGAGFRVFAVDHVGLRLDVPPGNATGRGQRLMANTRGGCGFEHGGGRVPPSPLPVVSRARAILTSLASDVLRC
jgi:hypothetical protein